MFNYSKKTLMTLAISSLFITPMVSASTNKVIMDNAEIVSIKNLQSLKDQTSNKKSELHIHKFTTESGITVLFSQTKELPIVDMEISFDAGSARDATMSKQFGKPLQGVASLTADILSNGLLPHNAFSEKPLNENEISAIVEQNAFNLYANADQDTFSVGMRSLSTPQFLDKATRLFNSILIKPSFPQESLERVKKQLHVKLVSLQKNPNYIATMAFNRAIYGNHPYAEPDSGTLATIPNIERKHLQAYKDKFLVAKNATIAITGNISREEAKKIAENATKNLQQGNKVAPLPQPKPIKAQHIHIPFTSSQTTIIVGQLGVTSNYKQKYALRVANKIFGGGSFEARLMKELREKRGLTYGAYSSYDISKAQGTFSMSLSTRNEQAGTALKVLKSTLDTYIKKGATQEEVEETKVSIINRFPLSMTTNSSINDKLQMINYYGYPLDYMNNYTSQIAKVTKSSSDKAFSSLVNPQQMITITVGPKKPE